MHVLGMLTGANCMLDACVVVCLLGMMASLLLAGITQRSWCGDCVDVLHHERGFVGTGRLSPVVVHGRTAHRDHAASAFTPREHLRRSTESMLEMHASHLPVATKTLYK